MATPAGAFSISPSSGRSGDGERLEVPIYLHPKDPPPAVYSAYYADLRRRPRVSFDWCLGWHVDTGMQIMRMIVGRVFDEFPGLQVIIGHMGEGMPFMLGRATDGIAEVGLRVR